MQVITKDSILQNGLDALKENTLQSYEHLRITKEKNIPQPEPTITIGGAAIASPGNITAIGAPAKAGKTATASVILAGAISKTGEVDGFGPDFKVRPNINGYAVINIDTEQSEADQQQNVKSVLRRAGFETTPEYYQEYNIRQIPITLYKEVTADICELCAKQFGGIHLIVIDGGADFILSVNDESAATLIIQDFIHLSIKYLCPVIVIVHQNPGSEKERGHFGSEIQRKCYGLLTITRDGDISTLSPKMMRRTGHGDVPLISFKYCKEKGYHVPVDAVDKDEERDKKDRAKHKKIADEVFAPPTALSYSDAVSKIMDKTNLKERSAKTMISNMSGWEYIKKGNDGFYRIKTC